MSERNPEQQLLASSRIKMESELQDNASRATATF